MENNTTTPQAAPEQEQHIDGGMQALVRMLRILFQGLRILIILIFVYLIFSGMFRVDDQNEAMLFRFGKLQKRVLDPEKGETPILTSGRWYWAWPYPIDWVKEIPAQKSVFTPQFKREAELNKNRFDTKYLRETWQNDSSFSNTIKELP